MLPSLSEDLFHIPEALLHSPLDLTTQPPTTVHLLHPILFDCAHLEPGAYVVFPDPGPYVLIIACISTLTQQTQGVFMRAM